jgi:glucose-6-phosphate isomerase
MWDWVGGRTSETSAVGLLPAALQGLDINAFLGGAAACDQLTRRHALQENPAAQLALAWHFLGGGRGAKDMVILPYKDRLELFSKYLQQLIMESLGKEKDLDGRVVNQGIAVYGNKGSTDQHAYVQQLRDGINNFFVTFIEVLKDREGAAYQVEPGITSGDYLSGFYLGTRQALWESDRQSITVTIKVVNAFSVGVLIALYERTVGLYAQLIHINAYHQPGVEAGKKAATAILQLQTLVFEFLSKNSSRGFSAAEIAQSIQRKGAAEPIFKICQHLAANGEIAAEGQGTARTFRAQRA